MKLKSKLIIGFGALMAILIVLTMVGYDRLNYMNKQLDQIYQERYLKVRNSSGVRGEVNNISRLLVNSMLNKSNNLDEAKEQIKAMIANGDQNLAKLIASTDSPEEKQMLNRVQSAWEGYKTYEEKQMAFVDQGLWDQANLYRNTSGLSLQMEALDSMNELASFQDLQIDSEIKNVKASYNRSIQITTAIMIAGLLLGLAVIMWVIPSITKGLNVVSMMISSFGKGRIKTIRRIKVTSKDEIGQIANVFKEMAEDLDEKQQLELSYLQAQKDQNWLNSNVSQITELLRGLNSRQQVSQAFISEFTPVLGASYGAIYIHDEDKEPNKLILNGTYAGEGISVEEKLEIGEGLIGQSAMDRKTIIMEVPENYLTVSSAFGHAKPAHLMIQPVVFEDELLGVIEIAAFEPFTELQQQLFSQLGMNLGIVINNINRRLRVEELLRESQALTEELQCQSEELQTQQEELRRSNENLEEQTEALKNSEDLLQRQQEELEHFNTELIAKTRALEEQMQQLEEKNIEVEDAKSKLEQQAMQLAVTSKYKSEFLANMSHELRTPLNSLLILSQLLAENKDGNLNDKQTEYAHTIYMSGADLLKMIDEILDLSKVDAGKMEINREEVPIKDWKGFVNQNFMPMANKKQLALKVSYEADLPESIVTDGYRVKQIIRNLLSNAFKFTTQGSISFHVKRADSGKLPPYLNRSKPYLALAVKDTGIGIPKDKTELIFEAFQQVDGTTSRKYGGTGLGLSISRELSRLLGGGIELQSVEGEGSCFTLYLPLTSPEASAGAQAEAAASAELMLPEETIPSKKEQPEGSSETIAAVPMEDDRNHIGEKDKVLLIIEDDVNFANILLDMARGRGFKGLVALQGDVGLKMAQSYLPDAIILDIQLPVMDGWSILGELKSDSATRHIPVHIVSVVDEVKQGLKMGAIAYLKKPSSKSALERAFSHMESYTDHSVKHLLIVEDDDIQRRSIIELIDHDDVAITAVSTGKEALNELRKQRYDSMVLDLMLSDMTGFELLDQIQQDEELEDLPIIIYTGKDLDSKEEMRLRKYAESIIIKDVKSPERLLDETTLFLHRVEANLPEDKRKILQKLHNKEVLFEGKRILLVDDDIRNVFALSSVLEGYEMDVTFAENGREAIDILNSGKPFDLVLMDMMMPEMDGYEAMRLIRQQPEFHKLPIIALTAKAMKEDRSKCIEAGASDYVKKPIQTEQLLSLMRVWLYS